MQYSNPQQHLVVNDWPYGAVRTVATFTIEKTRRGERCTRVTVNPKSGQPNKPKSTVYGKSCRIVTGEDGRTYVAALSQFGFIYITKSDLHYTQETIQPGDANFVEVMNLLGS